MTQFLATPVDKSLSTIESWIDIDLSSDIPATATGAIFRVKNNSDVVPVFGLRKNGSTDTRKSGIWGQDQLFVIIGVDSNRKCEGYIETTNVDFYLIGYTEADATFFTNGVDKSLGATGAWTDIDLSSNIPSGSVAAVFVVANTHATVDYGTGLRKNGSTDNRTGDLYFQTHYWLIVGVDSNRKCEGYIESTSVDFYLIGYLTQGQAETNAHDRSLGTIGSYVDIDESSDAPSGATGVFGEVTTTGDYKFAARKNGTSFDYYDDVNTMRDGLFAGLDANRKWEGKIENAAVNFYTLGYFSPGIVEKNSSDVGVGVDAQSELLSSRSEAETGSGVDIKSSLESAVIRADLGAGVDAILTSLASRSEAETGSGTDALVSLLKVIAKFGSDTGVGADVASDIIAEIENADVGAGVEAGTVSKIINVLSDMDDGVGAEAISQLLAEISKSDTGTGLEALGSRLLSNSDAGTGVDALKTLSDIIPTKSLYHAKLGGVTLWIPELSKQNFTITKEENDIPRFDFTLQNCSVNRTALEDHLDDSFIIYRDSTPIFTGLINCDQIEYKTINQIAVKGFAKWIELSYSIYRRMADADAESAEKVLIRDDPSSWTDRTTEAGNDTINDVTVTFNGANDGIYIGDGDVFNSIKVKYSTKGVQTGTPTFNVQYSKGSGVWATIDCVDESREFTNDPDTYFIFMPTLPSDWAKDTVNGHNKYWIRIILNSGSYSTDPKLDRIWISQTDVCRVQFDNVAANTMLDSILDGTEYSVDGTDQCPTTVIPSIRGEYESRLRWIAGIINALEWEDGNGDAQSYAWWIDDTKKVHVKQTRGSTYGDITTLTSVLGNRLNYFNIANRIFGLGGGTSINQYRAIVENRDAQDTLNETRETTYRDSRLFDYALLKTQSRKLLTQSKVAQGQVQCTMPIYDWFEGGYDIGDTIKLHQPKWGIPNETEYTIRRVDISLSDVKFDVGIGREHLDSLQGNIQQQLDIHDVYMQGETSTFQVGPVETNYQRVDASTVYPVKMLIEVPTNAKAINKALISWKLGDYRASTTGTGTGGGHAHSPASPNTGLAGGHAHGDYVGLGGGAELSELGKAHTHPINDAWVELSGFEYSSFNPVTGSTTAFESTHTHPKGSTGGPDDVADAVDSIYAGTSCESGWCITGSSGSSFAEASHYHLNTGLSTGTGTQHHHVINKGNQVWALTNAIDANLRTPTANEDSPGHIHTINPLADHNDHGISAQGDVTHTLPNTDTLPDFDLGLEYGVHEEPGGTIMELIINGVTVGSSYNGDKTDLKIRGYLQTGRNDVILQPAVGQNHKGSAQMDATIKVFMDTE